MIKIALIYLYSLFLFIEAVFCLLQKQQQLFSLVMLPVAYILYCHASTFKIQRDVLYINKKLSQL
jgi:hypothetical protein